MPNCLLLLPFTQLVTLYFWSSFLHSLEVSWIQFAYMALNFFLFFSRACSSLEEDFSFSFCETDEPDELDEVDEVDELLVRFSGGCW